MGLWPTSSAAILGVVGYRCPYYASASSHIIFFAAAQVPLEWSCRLKDTWLYDPKLLG
jgi:hypothetical protein